MQVGFHQQKKLHAPKIRSVLKKSSTSAFESLDLALRSDIKAVKDTHTTTCYGYERKRAERRESLHVLFSTVWALTTDDTDWCRKVYGVVVLCKLKMNVQGKGNATTEHSSHTAMAIQEPGLAKSSPTLSCLWQGECLSMNLIEWVCSCSSFHTQFTWYIVFWLFVVSLVCFYADVASKTSTLYCYTMLLYYTTLWMLLC